MNAHVWHARTHAGEMLHWNVTDRLANDTRFQSAGIFQFRITFTFVDAVSRFARQSKMYEIVEQY